MDPAQEQEFEFRLRLEQEQAAAQSAAPPADKIAPVLPVGAPHQEVAGTFQNGHHLAVPGEFGMKPQTAENVASAVAAPLEAAATMGTGALATGAGAVNSFAGLLPESIRPGLPGTPHEIFKNTQEALTYQPRTEEGKAIVDKAGAIPNAVIEQANRIAPEVGDALQTALALAPLKGAHAVKGSLTRGFTIEKTPTTPLTVKAPKPPSRLGKLFMAPDAKAASIVKDAAGDNLSAVRAAAAVAPADLTAVQAIHGAAPDVLHAIGEEAASRDTTGHFAATAERQAADQRAQLEKLAGGANQSEALDTQAASRANLRQITDPMREQELEAANRGATTARVDQPEAARLEAQATKDAEQASTKVEDVRRLNTAGEIAKDRASVPGFEAPMGRNADLAAVAEKNAQLAADESVRLGEASREAKQRAAYLKSRGLEPLNTDKVTGHLRNQLNDPAVGANKINERVLSNVADQIDKWTAKGGGYIDAKALYEIRKSAINDEIETQLGSADPKAKALRASELLSKVKPLIDQAITDAGGKRWADYLKTYSEGVKTIDQKAMGMKALDLFDKGVGKRGKPGRLEQLASGNDVAAVQDVFGQEHNLRRAMGGPSAIDEVAAALKRDREIKNAAARGAGGARVVLEKYGRKVKLPNMLSHTTAIANKTFDVIENASNRDTAERLTRAFRSGADLEELLKQIPAPKRHVVREALRSLKAGVGNAASQATGASVDERRRQAQAATLRQ